jgi:hypothetical protein
MVIHNVAPGDVLAVLDTNSLLSKGIRFFEWLGGKPDLVDHVVVVTHQDSHGRWIGVAGKPGGVSLCQIDPYLAERRTRSNHAQQRPNDEGQLKMFLASCAKSLGVAYDWVGMVADAAEDLRLHDLSNDLDDIWSWPASGQLPGHVVCSSLAAWLYEAVGWAHPDMGAERLCEPGDWWAWNNTQGWEAVT